MDLWFFFSKIPKSKMNEKSGSFFIKKCTHSAYFYNILSYIYFVSFAVIYVPIHVFHNMNILNAIKIQHSKFINKNVSLKKWKIAIWTTFWQFGLFLHFLCDMFLFITFECCTFLALNIFIIWNICIGIYITTKLTR